MRTTIKIRLIWEASHAQALRDSPRSLPRDEAHGASATSPVSAGYRSSISSG